MKYDYTKKSWNIDAQSLSDNKGNKHYLRYIVIGAAVIIIAILIWAFSGDSSSHKGKEITTSPTATAAKSTAAKPKKKDDYVTIPLKLPNS